MNRRSRILAAAVLGLWRPTPGGPRRRPRRSAAFPPSPRQPNPCAAPTPQPAPPPPPAAPTSLGWKPPASRPAIMRSPPPSPTLGQAGKAGQLALQH